MKRLLLLAAALFTGHALLAQGVEYERRLGLLETLPVKANSIVFLGNSITEEGEWAELFDNRHVLNRGISGDRTEWMLRRLDPIIAGHPKRLFLLIGTNDLAAGIAPEQVAENVARIVDRFREESRWTKIFVQSVLPVNGKEFGFFRDHYARAADIPRLNELLRTLCEERNVVFIDLYTPFCDEEGHLDSTCTNDGLHITGAGYLRWRDLLKPYVK